MKTVLKWLGYVVGVLVVLIVLAVGTVYLVSAAKFSKTYPTKFEHIAVSTDSASLARGRHLVAAVGKCQMCHGDDLAGKKVLDDPIFAQLTSTNLTSGKGGIGATYTDDDFVRAIRHGVGKDGKSLFFMPAEAFYHFNDADLGAIVGYIRTVPPVDSPVSPERKIGPVGRAVYLMTPFPLVPASLVPHDAPRAAAVPVGVTREYGEYLTKAGGCTSCHGPSLSGGTKIEGLVAPNLTPGDEVGKWTESDFFRTIRTGVRPNGKILSAVMPWPYAKNMTDDEMRATWMYIHSLPAKKLGED